MKSSIWSLYGKNKFVKVAHQKCDICIYREIVVFKIDLLNLLK